MINYLITIIFGLSLAFASGGILISSHLRITYKTDFLSSLLFFQVFWFTFGFYTIWGQIILAALLKSLVEPEHLVKITNITIFMGSPFLLFAWFMFIKFAREISGRNTGGSFVALSISLSFLLIPGLGYLITLLTGIKVIDLVKHGFMILCILYTIIGTYVMLTVNKKQSRLKYNDIKDISLGLLLIMFLQNFMLFFYKSNIYIALAFIFLYYAYGAFMPVYFRYKADLSKLLMPGENNLSIDRFCEKFEISKREKEVIHEICSGLSNQQIADKLFISLQTVKDHTHRIYGKTNCISRAQLMRMVNEGIWIYRKILN
ncbi:MAG TPA: helix-turn-helix transcriptional regulator [Bacteroidales bacterium]|nr:helix-turn-helix transcriptional regulator [Bacteroidales bacterium]